jgi:hypothetical protein
MTRHLLCLALLFGATASVQEQAQAVTTTQASIPGKGKYMGVIAKIDATKGVLGMKTKSGKPLMVKATAKTKVVIAGKPAKFSDLAVGDKILVKGKLDKKKKVVIAAVIASK